MLPVSDFKIRKRNSFNLIGRVRVKFLIIATLLVSSVFFAQLVFANALATDGIKLVQIQEEINKLEEENINMRTEIYQDSSLNSLHKKANQYGFENSSFITSF